MSYKHAYKLLYKREPLDAWCVKYAYPGFRDGNAKNLNLDNLYWKFHDHFVHTIPGIDVPTDTYVKIFGHPEYEINGFGQVRNVSSGRIKTPIYTDYGTQIYLQMDLWSNGEVVRRNLHRLLALTFLPHPFDTSSMVVNHIDGNGLNNHLTNLEWCTYSHNIDHAYETGLRTDNVSVSVKHQETGEVKVFRSWHKAAEHIGVKPQALHDWVKKSSTFRLYHGYLVKPTSDKTDWPIFPLIEKRKEKISIERKSPNGEINQFDNLSASVVGTPIKLPTLRYRLNKSNTTILNGYSFSKTSCLSR